MPTAELESGEFTRLTRPLRRLKVSLVWQDILRYGHIAAAVRFTAAQYGITCKTAEDTLNDPKARSRIAHRRLCLELGSLGDSYPYSDRRRGEASINFGLWWRVESPRAVVFRSDDNRAEVQRELESFRGRRIVDVQSVGRLPDITVTVAGRRWIQSLDTVWSIRLPDERVISSRSGHLVCYSH